MQLDFHHATTYVAARLAGFNKRDADIVAYAAQYVDDATSSGTVYFDNKAIYHRISSAHKMVDKRNVKSLANHLVWLPFHFLPGNGGLDAGLNPEGRFIEKIVCTPHSPISEAMVQQAIVEKDKPYGLHRLGVTLHVYADTWAHQGFAGVLHPVNDIENARETGTSGVFKRGLRQILNDIIDDAIPPLGHGRATTFPDMPFLQWDYRNYKGEIVSRNNTELFCDAAQHLCKAMQRYIAGDPHAEVPGIKSRDMRQIEQLLATCRREYGSERHATWLMAIRDGIFSFGAEEVSYSGKGKGSWKEKALGSNFDQPVSTYREAFLMSDWKLFHDAIQAHRFFIIHDLLPHYGICAA
jgi:hypothetical protein